MRTVGSAALTATSAVLMGCSSAEGEAADASVEYNGPRWVSVDPENGAENVPTDKVIRVTFDDHLDGRNLDQNKLDLQSGPTSLWLMFFYDPVRYQLVVWPSSLMYKKATWVLSAEADLAGLDGEIVEPGEIVSFRTGEGAGDNQPFVKRSFENEILPIFKDKCGSCHGGSATALVGLRLDYAEGIGNTAVGVGSEGWPGWKRIAPASPGASYLLYKVIGDRRIAGMRMPRAWGDEQPPPLGQAEKEAISDWIAAGAQLFDPDSDGE